MIPLKRLKINREQVTDGDLLIKYTYGGVRVSRVDGMDRHDLPTTALIRPQSAAHRTYLLLFLNSKYLYEREQRRQQGRLYSLANIMVLEDHELPEDPARLEKQLKGIAQIKEKVRQQLHLLDELERSLVYHYHNQEEDKNG